MQSVFMGLLNLIRELVEDERNFVTVIRTDVDDSMAYCNFCKAHHPNEYRIEHAPECPITKARTIINGFDRISAIS